MVVGAGAGFVVAGAGTGVGVVVAGAGLVYTVPDGYFGKE